MAALILTAHLTSNNLEFSRYNTNWNGTSQFFSDLDRHHTEMILDRTQLAPYQNNALLLIIAPERSPTGAEITAYQAFLDRGNTIVLADDFGTGAEILRRIGAGSRSLAETFPVSTGSMPTRTPLSFTRQGTQVRWRTAGRSSWTVLRRSTGASP